MIFNAPVSQSDSLPFLTSTRLIARNTVFNLAGQIIPLFAALIAIPLLIDGIGTERFGLLSISWMLLGYFGLFDLGLGRVMTKLVGEKLGSNAHADIPAITWTGMLFMLILGFLTMILVLFLAPVLVHRVLDIPDALLSEANSGFIILALCIPVVTVSTGLRGILEAYQKFGIVNIIRILNGILLFTAPLLLLPRTVRLPWYIGALVTVRVLVFAAYAVFCFISIPALHNSRINMSLIRPMFKLGGWMSVSNIIGPFMVYFDRFLIGVWISVAAVTFYVTPWEVVTKMLLIAAAVVRVLFPAFSASYHSQPDRAAILYSRGLKTLMFMSFPICLIFITLAEPGLRLWLGDQFAAKGTVVAQWLALGCFLNAQAQVAFTFIQASGRPDITAKLHLLEMPVYVAGLWLLIQHFGIAGAAMAWTGRIAIETVLLLLFAEKIHRSEQNNQRIYISLLLCTSSAFLLTVPGTLMWRSLGFIFILALFILLFWFYITSAQERTKIHFLLKRK